jgi:hypothetical protein
MITHYWHALPGPQWFSASHIYTQQVRSAIDGAVFVELGAWKGRSTSCMAVEIANSGKRIHFYTVDHWIGSLDEVEHRKDEDVRLNRLYEVFSQNIAPVRDYVQPIRSDSAEAAEQFGDQSIDFLFLDAGHSYIAAARDIAAWWPKLKHGGTLAGDDWSFIDEHTGEYGVRRAITEFCAPAKIPIQVLAGDPNPKWKQWIIVK